LVICHAGTGQRTTLIRREIDAIDRLVYELCRLSDEEIAIVEEAT
jgi:hypothetical protein